MRQQNSFNSISSIQNKKYRPTHKTKQEVETEQKNEQQQENERICGKTASLCISRCKGGANVCTEGVPVVVVVSLRRRQRAVTVVHLQGTHAHPALLGPETRPDRGSYVLFLGHQLIGLNAPLSPLDAPGPPTTPAPGSDRTIHSTSIHPQICLTIPTLSSSNYPIVADI